MSETKHTPGPWEALITDEELMQPGDDFPVSSSSGDDLAAVHLGDDLSVYDEAAANARLIAAAPDLLAVTLAYEQWEADMVMCQAAWRGGVAPLPTLTQELWDRLMEIQTMRNAAKKKAQGA